MKCDGQRFKSCILNLHINQIVVFVSSCCCVVVREMAHLHSAFLRHSSWISSVHQTASERVAAAAVRGRERRLCTWSTWTPVDCFWPDVTSAILCPGWRRGGGRLLADRMGVSGMYFYYFEGLGLWTQSIEILPPIYHNDINSSLSSLIFGFISLLIVAPSAPCQSVRLHYHMDPPGWDTKDQETDHVLRHYCLDIIAFEFS